MVIDMSTPQDKIKRSSPECVYFEFDPFKIPKDVQKEIIFSFLNKSRGRVRVNTSYVTNPNGVSEEIALVKMVVGRTSHLFAYFSASAMREVLKNAEYYLEKKEECADISFEVWRRKVKS